MPCLYFPGFYFVQNSMNGNLPLFEKTQSLYKQNIKNDAIKCGTIWFPIHLINFSVVPAAYRGYFSACAGFIWAAYLLKHFSFVIFLLVIFSFFGYHHLTFEVLKG